MFARTKRLTLRPGWPEDAAALAKAIGHESVVTKISQAPWPYTAEDALDFLSRPRPDKDAIMLITVPEDTTRIIGCIGVHADGDAHELGYWLTPEAWGQGYATEAGRQAVQIARHALGLKRLNAGHHIDNPASGRVLAKLGFKPTGRIEQHYCRARGHHVPCVKMALDLDEDRPCEQRLAA
ncbi:GNAT family N-acetyltransferase [Sphingomonas qilianensis]|uniref:GNAT family N-acetyltransferase n=1 Tax=Sphingomonas qilianensis TaxID=1736690 RepID=A0ABU9XPB5_9SPHN